MKPARNQGFSLIEVMVVLFLLSLMTGIVAVSFSQADGLRWDDFKSALKTLDRDLREISKNQRGRVELSVSIRDEEIEGTLNGKRIPGGLLRFPRNFNLKGFFLGDELKRVNKVSFDPSGLAHDYTLVFYDQEKFQKVLFVVGKTGQLNEFENEGQVRKFIEAIQRADLD